MKTIKQVNTENRRNYFFNEMTNISDFDPSLLVIDQVSFKSDKLIM